MYWDVKEDGSMNARSVDKHYVGNSISTRAPGSEKREDITGDYKYPDGKSFWHMINHVFISLFGLVCICLSVCLSACLSVHSSVVSQSVSQSINQSIHQSAGPTVGQSVSQSVSLSACPAVSQSVCRLLVCAGPLVKQLGSQSGSIQLFRPSLRQSVRKSGNHVVGQSVICWSASVRWSSS